MIGEASWTLGPHSPRTAFRVPHPGFQLRLIGSTLVFVCAQRSLAEEGVTRIVFGFRSCLTS